MKTAVVTGGAGFVGSHLCERLRDEGYRVISLDNYFTGSKDNHVPGVEYREGHTKDIHKHITEKPDIVFHLGEYARVEQSVLEPEVVEDLNTVGTDGVINFWRTYKCKLVYAGSSTKFGDNIDSPYAKTKAQNSEKIRMIGDHESLPYAITYFYNGFGPRERSGVYGTLIEHFKRMYLSGAPCAVVRPGTQKRNFTHVLDLVEGLIVVGDRGMGDEYGLGNLHAYSVLEVAEFFGFKNNIVFFPERTGNRMGAGLDTTKINQLGWSATRSLPEYIDTFKKNHKPGTKKEKRILVFSTTFSPIGRAEDAFIELARALPDVNFDVIASRFSQERVQIPMPNISVHYVGFGIPLDKFFLPLFGFFAGFSLYKKHRYLFTWSLMASYAAIAGIFLKFVLKRPLLITLADQTINNVDLVRRVFFSLMLSRADQIYGTHRNQEIDMVHAIGTPLPRASLGEGDAFANALRYAYADIIRTRSIP